MEAVGLTSVEAVVETVVAATFDFIMISGAIFSKGAASFLSSTSVGREKSCHVLQKGKLWDLIKSRQDLPVSMSSCSPSSTRSGVVGSRSSFRSRIKGFFFFLAIKIQTLWPKSSTLVKILFWLDSDTHQLLCWPIHFSTCCSGGKTCWVGWEQEGDLPQGNPHFWVVARPALDPLLPLVPKLRAQDHSFTNDGGHNQGKAWHLVVNTSID